MQCGGKQGQSEGGGQAGGDRPVTSPYQDDRPGQESQERRRAGASGAAAGVGEGRAGVGGDQPARQGPGIAQGRERRGPVLPQAVDRRGGLVLPIGQLGKDEGDCSGQAEREKRQARGPSPRAPGRCDETEHDPPRHEHRRVREQHGDGRQSDQCPEPANRLAATQPVHRGDQQEQGDEQVRGIGLGLGGMANRMHAHGEDADGHHGPEILTAEDRACESPHEKETAQTTENRKQSQRPFGEPGQVEDETLGPEVEQGGDLAIVERPEQVEISPPDEVDGDETLVRPER